MSDLQNIDFETLYKVIKTNRMDMYGTLRRSVVIDEYEEILIHKLNFILGIEPDALPSREDVLKSVNKKWDEYWERYYDQ